MFRYISLTPIVLLSYDMLEDTPQATEWFTQLISIVPTDPAILSRLGELFDNEGDKSQAYQYHYEVSNLLSREYPRSRKYPLSRKYMPRILSEI